MAKKASDVLTGTEVAAVVSRLEGTACSVRRVRYLLSAGERVGHGRTRLHAAADVALVRLALRLEREGVSSWVARVVVAYLRDELIAAFESRARVALRLVGIRGAIVRDAAEERTGNAVFVPLRPICEPLASEIRRVRVKRPTVWMWRELSPAVARVEVLA
jgi:hypothetical protein